ncbi:MAG: hypothetical protein LBJ31_12220 [Treponema sp.]|jgi:tetratricopeptide (TPR) repeat protein|nr:hypothetical protein [Treponema sp.]
MPAPGSVSKIYSKDIFLKLDQADVLLDEDKDDEAIKLYTKVIDVYPDEAYAYARRGWVLLKQRRNMN